MKTLSEISYDNRISAQTLYKRLLVREIPFEYKDGVRAIEEDYIPELLKEGQKGRRLSKELLNKIKLDNQNKV